MNILIATGIYPPDIGGPAQYARGVEEAWRQEGHQVRVLVFSRYTRFPTGIRHLVYFFKVLFALPRVDFVFSPDTWSAAFPATVAATLLRKKIIIRTGGDFLWEWYVERTGDLVLLKDFYATRIHAFNLKERTIFASLRFLFRHASAIIFSTKWQRDIFAKPYQLDLQECFIVENYFGERDYSNVPQNIGIGKKIFVGGTRALKWKNIERVTEAFEKVQRKGIAAELQLQTGSRGQFLLDIQSSYAVILASLGDISPNTILEAIQFGKPFILTRETGLYEKLRDIGVWVNPEDVNDIASKIMWLSDEKNYEGQCRKIREFLFTHSYEEIAREISTIYHHPKA